MEPRLSALLAVIAKHACGAAWVVDLHGRATIRWAPGLDESARLAPVIRSTRDRAQSPSAEDVLDRCVLGDRVWSVRVRAVDSYRAVGMLVRDDAFEPIVTRAFDHVTHALSALAARGHLGLPPSRTGETGGSGAPAQLGLPVPATQRSN